MHSLHEPTLRDTVFDRLTQLFELIPDVTQDLWDAANKKKLPPETLATIYDKLGLFLQSYPEYRRIVLYLPFELLPDRNDIKSANSQLKKSALFFVKHYLKRWKELLLVSDVRTNFIDGDVPEDHLLTEPLPRTIKAAQLIPLLIRKNILSRKEAQTLWLESDGLLNETLTEVLGYVGTPAPDGLFSSQDLIENQFITDRQNLTVARASWLRSIRIHTLIEKSALQLVEQIKLGAGSIDDLKKYLTANVYPTIQQTGIIALREYVQHLSETDLLSAQQLASSLTELLTTLWETASHRSKDLIRILVSHFAYLKIIPKDSSLLQLTQIPFPSFAHFFIETTNETSQLFDELRGLAKTIETDEVSQYVYPVIIAYGSHIKGYSGIDADIDIAVLVKPGTEVSKREYIHKRLSQILTHEKIKELPTEFWITNNNGMLGIRDYTSFSHPDNQIGDSLFIHILLQCPWIGNNELIQLLKPAVHAIYTRNTTPAKRNLWAASLEHDIIQYRLLHKGYARLFPKQIPVAFPGVVDTESSFWDSGFRRLATLLYIKKVMVPIKK
jgi:predicted nucleotidyltransferase